MNVCPPSVMTQFRAVSIFLSEFHPVILRIFLSLSQLQVSRFVVRRHLSFRSCRCFNARSLVGIYPNNTASFIDTLHTRGGLIRLETFHNTLLTKPPSDKKGCFANPFSNAHKQNFYKCTQPIISSFL